MIMETTKICTNCGAIVHWNPLGQRWNCKWCGNSIDYKEDQLNQSRLPRL